VVLIGRKLRQLRKLKSRKFFKSIFGLGHAG
jgi:hypothetical protein